MAKIKVLDSNITVVKVENEDYISLTDMLKSFDKFVKKLKTTK